MPPPPLPEEAAPPETPALVSVLGSMTPASHPSEKASAKIANWIRLRSMGLLEGRAPTTLTPGQRAQQSA